MRRITDLPDFLYERIKYICKSIDGILNSGELSIESRISILSIVAAGILSEVSGEHLEDNIAVFMDMLRKNTQIFLEQKEDER